jgi:hypothetical protein
MLYRYAYTWKTDVLPISMMIDGKMYDVDAWRLKKNRTTKEYRLVSRSGSNDTIVIEVNHGMWWKELKDEKVF